MPDVVEEKEVEALAIQGDMAAQLYLGWGHTKHGSYPLDDTKADYWLRKAASANSVVAKRHLSRFLYEKGSVETIRIATELVDQGDFYGNYVMGHLYAHGECGVQKDIAVAIEHFKTATKQGHLVSNVDLLRFSRPLGLLNPLGIVALAKVFAKIIRVLARDKNDDRVFR